MSLTNVQAVMFDLDGTLVDSEPIAESAFRVAFDECGGVGTAPVEQFFALAGSPFDDICEKLVLPAGMGAAFRRAAQARTSSVKFFAGIESLLQQLAHYQIAMGIITGKDRPRTEILLRHLGVGKLFGAIVTPSDAPSPKPSPEGIRWLCEALNVNYRQVVMVGDSWIDMQTGRAAGVTTIGSTWGVADAETLLAGGADFIVNTVDELAAYLLPAVDASLNGRASWLAAPGQAPT